MPRELRPEEELRFENDDGRPRAPKIRAKRSERMPLRFPRTHLDDVLGDADIRDLLEDCLKNRGNE
jgi:hypothetical protein